MLALKVHIRRTIVLVLFLSFAANLHAEDNEKRGCGWIFTPLWALYARLAGNGENTSPPTPQVSFPVWQSPLSGRQLDPKYVLQFKSQNISEVERHIRNENFVVVYYPLNETDPTIIRKSSQWHRSFLERNQFTEIFEFMLSQPALSHSADDKRRSVSYPADTLVSEPKSFSLVTRPQMSRPLIILDHREAVRIDLIFEYISLHLLSPGANGGGIISQLHIQEFLKQDRLRDGNLSIDQIPRERIPLALTTKVQTHSISLTLLHERALLAWDTGHYLLTYANEMDLQSSDKAMILKNVVATTKLFLTSAYDDSVIDMFDNFSDIIPDGVARLDFQRSCAEFVNLRRSYLSIAKYMLQTYFMPVALELQRNIAYKKVAQTVIDLSRDLTAVMPDDR